MSDFKFVPMDEDVSEILIPAAELKTIVSRLGKEITAHYKSAVEQGEKLLVVCVLKGSVIFFSDLVRAIDLPLELSFMQASSYGKSTISGGVVEIRLAPTDAQLKDAHVLIVEDILDTGHTMHKVQSVLADKGTKSVKLCTLLDKPSRRQAPITADFAGKEVPDLFVIGYGLDYGEKYRNLDYVGVLKPEVYEV